MFGAGYSQVITAVCAIVLSAHMSGPGRRLHRQTGSYTDNLTQTGVVR